MAISLSRAGRKLTGPYLPVVILVLLGAVLVGLRVNQSSVGMYGTAPAERTGLGIDRPIRSDEWYVRLPWLLSQESRDYAPTMVTAGSHDPSVTYDLPVRDLSVILKPHLLPYLFLGFDRALSAEWWFLVLGCAIALYVLLLRLRVRPSISLPIAVIVASSPGLHWWTVSSSFDIIIYSALGVATALTAIDATRPITRFGCAAVAGWLFSCAAVVLYPPFQIPTMVAAGLIVISVLLEPARRRTLTKNITTLAAVGGVFIMLTAWFVMRHRAGLGSMASTVYPGTRRSTAGGANIASLFGTPFDSKASGIVAGSVNKTNQSENSSTFLLALPVLMMLPFGRSDDSSRSVTTLVRVLTTWFAVLLSWMLLPLPSIVGRITLLDRVPPDRLKPSIATVSAIVAALFMEHMVSSTSRARRVSAIAVFSFITVWAGSVYLVDDKPISSLSIWLLGALWLVPAAIAYLKRPAVGLALLAFVSLMTAARINPLHQSVDPIRNNSLYAAMKKADPKMTSPWVTFSGSAQVRGIMVATGAHVESGVSPYPDRAFWARFDPTSMYEGMWNRYGHVHFVIGQGRTRITSPQSDVIEVSVDPCATGSPIKSGTLLVEGSADSVPCAGLVTKIEYQGTNWFILRKD